jgi:hypothetical protein
MGSDPQSYLQYQHDRQYGDIKRLLRRVYAYLQKIDHVHLPDGSILRASEVAKVLDEIDQK